MILQKGIVMLILVVLTFTSCKKEAPQSEYFIQIDDNERESFKGVTSCSIVSYNKSQGGCNYYVWEFSDSAYHIEFSRFYSFDTTDFSIVDIGTIEHPAHCSDGGYGPTIGIKLTILDTGEYYENEIQGTADYNYVNGISKLLITDAKLHLASDHNVTITLNAKVYCAH